MPQLGLMRTAWPAVCIVVLNWNGRDDTLACLASVRQINYPNFRTIVVDNGSIDNSIAAIKAAHPDVEVIEAGTNLGFSGGNNLGIKRALGLHADYILILNNDTIVDAGLVRAFVEAADRFPGAGAFSGTIFFHDEPDRTWFSGLDWDPSACRFVPQTAASTTGFSSARETAYACGCAFFVSASKLREVGLLCDDFFLYFEETDWCYRARKKGYPSMIVPEARLFHKVAASVGGDDSPLALYFVTRNRLLWAKRHLDWRQRLTIHKNSLLELARRFIRPALANLPVFRPSLRERWWALRDAYLEPRNQAFLLGLRDYWLRQFGDCPPLVRELALRARTRGYG